MDFAIKFTFDILAFTSVMVLFVLGLDVIAAPIVVGLEGLVLERTIIRRFYATLIIAMVGPTPLA